jgi:hypothetical protein
MKLCIIPILVIMGTVLACAQGKVGINTNVPQATLHVAGTVRVDSLLCMSNATTVAAFDSVGNLGQIELDSLKGLLSGTGTSGWYWEEDSTVTTNSGNLTLRKSFILPPGRYCLTFYCEVRGGGGNGSVVLNVMEGNTLLGIGAPYCFYSQFCSWSYMKQVVLANATTFSLMWYSVTGGATSTMRVLHISAIKM